MPGIDKVRLDHSYQQYQQRTPIRRTDGTKPQFPFDPDEKGVIYEPTGAKENAAAKETDQAKPTVNKETGALTADATARETAGAKENSGAKEPAAGSSLTDWAFGLGKRFITFLRGLWDVIWNGPEKTESPGTGEQTGEARSDTVSAEQAESVGDIEKFAGERRAETLQQIIADHDMEQLVQFVTEGGTKKPARSTDLLTIYNRYGRVNYIDPSDRKKILEGNFNDIKL